jgi:hypothetical protein
MAQPQTRRAARPTVCVRQHDGIWPVVPQGGGVHGYVSGYNLDGRWTGCPHWYAGRCKRSGEPVERCAVAGWGPGAGRC